MLYIRELINLDTEEGKWLIEFLKGCLKGDYKFYTKENSMNDNWEHRNENMSCRTCIWFVLKKPSKAKNEVDKIIFSIGRCRRHSPAISGYPAVFLGDWCGDHKLDENKI